MRLAPNSHAARSPTRCSAIFTLLLLAGCGGNIFTAASLTPTTSPAAYHAYGDSITAGATLASPPTQAYPTLVAANFHLPLTNRAIAGDQACDVPTRQIFANAESPTLANPTEYSLLIGTNDVDIKGTGAYEAVFLQCHQASVAWLATPLQQKILATSTSVTTTGPGHLDTSNHWNAWTTEARNATVSFTITLAVAGPIYAWPRLQDGNPATYSYSLDGTTIGAGVAQTTPAIATHNGTTDSLGFLRIAAIPAGTHQVTFTQTSSGSTGLSIVGIAAPLRQASPGLQPSVLLGTIPFQQPGFSYASCGISDAPCLQYIADIEADAALFVNDGLDVRLFDTRKYMFGTVADMNDGLHPNVTGQIELSHAVESVF